MKELLIPYKNQKIVINFTEKKAENEAEIFKKSQVEFLASVIR